MTRKELIALELECPDYLKTDKELAEWRRITVFSEQPVENSNIYSVSIIYIFFQKGDVAIHPLP